MSNILGTKVLSNYVEANKICVNSWKDGLVNKNRQIGEMLNGSLMKTGKITISSSEASKLIFGL